MDQKRARGKNFTEIEKNLLFELVMSNEFRNIIENKQTDGVTTARKNLPWQEITQKFNAQSQTGNRTAKQLHALYDNLNKTARSNIFSDKKNAYKTGGGSFTPKSSCLDQKIATVLKPQFTPLLNKFDSSAAYLDQQPSCSSQNHTMENYNIETETMSIDLEDSFPHRGTETDTHEVFQEEVIQLQEPEEVVEAEEVPAAEEVTGSERKQETTVGVPKRKQKYIESLTNRFVARKNLKDTRDAEIHAKKMEILDVEHQIKLRRLEIVTLQLERERRLQNLE